MDQMLGLHTSCGEVKRIQLLSDLSVEITSAASP